MTVNTTAPAIHVTRRAITVVDSDGDVAGYAIRRTWGGWYARTPGRRDIWYPDTASAVKWAHALCAVVEVEERAIAALAALAATIQTAHDTAFAEGVADLIAAQPAASRCN